MWFFKPKRTARSAADIEREIERVRCILQRALSERERALRAGAAEPAEREARAYCVIAQERIIRASTGFLGKLLQTQGNIEEANTIVELGRIARNVLPPESVQALEAEIHDAQQHLQDLVLGAEQLQTTVTELPLVGAQRLPEVVACVEEMARIASGSDPLDATPLDPADAPTRNDAKRTVEQPRKVEFES